MIKKFLPFSTLGLFVLTFYMGFCTVADAQVSGLTPEQQRLLNQLPATQRQQLLDRFLSTGQSGVAPAPPESGMDEAAESFPEEEPEEPDEDLPPVFEPGDIMVLMAIPEPDAPDEAAELLLQIHGRNPYTLDSGGQLELPGIRGISLVGLNEEQAKLRLEADPALGGIDVEVFRLPVEDLSARDLEPYGYSLFEGRSRSFQSHRNIPVPTDYVVGPGDVVRIQFFGTQNAQYEIPIDRGGSLSLPELGPVTVAGLSFNSMRDDIARRASEQLIGTQVSVTLSELRSIQAILVGDVEAPGSYTVSALATMMDVLFAGGGISENGSLRNVQLKRGGRVITKLDLYELLLNGDSSSNRRVRSGDVIFVPPAGPRVTVTGEVKRPAMYEFRSEISASEAIALAGGATAKAFLGGVKIERSVPAAGLAVIDVNLTREQGKSAKIVDGDILVVPGETVQVDQAVTLVGHVYRPGVYQWVEGMRLSRILGSSRMLRSQADPGYVLIRRESTPNGPIEVLSADIGAVWTGQAGAIDPVLAPRDKIYVFSFTEGREVYLKPIIEQLRLQAKSSSPTPIVKIGGRVKVPGDYPLEEGMTIADLVRAGGGLDESAFRDIAELTRYTTSDGNSRQTLLVDVELAKALDSIEAANILLQPFDYLNIKEITRWTEENVVEIGGEVAFPGTYPIYHGEALSSVLERAGGLTNFAFPEGSIFTREVLREREREQLDVLASRVESDLATLALSDPSQTEAISIGQGLLTQLKTAEPAGRLVIDLSDVVAGNTEKDIFLRNGDELVIPSKKQEVTVLGEVQYATSHLWEANLDRDDYIARSGGITVKADKRRIYVVRANGEVVVSNRSRFFSRSRGFDINPGDTVVVPLDTDRVKPLVLWTSATQILYNLAIAAAAVNSF